MIIRRMGPTTHRLTRGRAYTVTNGRITCDDGSTMAPMTDHEPSWKVLTSKQDVAAALLSIEQAERWVNNTSAEDIKSDAQEKSTTKMLKITTPTLINGQDASSFDIDQLIDMVTTEESHIEKLKLVKHKSKAIAKLAARHQANIDAIIVILDSRED